jgi:hypothetical protein
MAIMSPSDLEEQIYQDPFVPLRLTLASGDQVILDNPKRVMMTGLALYYLLADNPDTRIGKRVKIISIPNIVLVEPAGSRPRNGRGRR